MGKEVPKDQYPVSKLRNSTVSMSTKKLPPATTIFGVDSWQKKELLYAICPNSVPGTHFVNHATGWTSSILEHVSQRRPRLGLPIEKPGLLLWHRVDIVATADKGGGGIDLDQAVAEQGHGQRWAWNNQGLN